MANPTAQLQIDLNDGLYKRLAGFANRIGALLSAPRIRRNPHALGTLDDFLVVLYALILAKGCGFVDRTRRSIELDKIESTCLAGRDQKRPLGLISVGNMPLRSCT